MHPAFVSRSGTTSVPIWFVTSDNYAQVREELSGAARRFAETAKIEPKAGQSLLLPGADGALSGVLFGLEGADKPEKDRFLPGRLPGLLPAGAYRFANAPHDARLAALAFALGSYRFTRYRKADPVGAQLEVPETVDAADLARIAEGVALARDLINTPANDLGPAELEQAARDLASRHGASIQTTVPLKLRNDGCEKAGMMHHCNSPRSAAFRQYANKLLANTFTADLVNLWRQPANRDRGSRKKV